MEVVANYPINYGGGSHVQVSSGTTGGMAMVTPGQEMSVVTGSVSANPMPTATNKFTMIGAHHSQTSNKGIITSAESSNNVHAGPESSSKGLSYRTLDSPPECRNGLFPSGAVEVRTRSGNSLSPPVYGCIEKNGRTVRDEDGVRHESSRQFLVARAKTGHVLYYIEGVYRGKTTREVRSLLKKAKCGAPMLRKFQQCKQRSRLAVKMGNNAVNHANHYQAQANHCYQHPHAHMVPPQLTHQDAMNITPLAYQQLKSLEQLQHQLPQKQFLQLAAAVYAHQQRTGAMTPYVAQIINNISAAVVHNTQNAMRTGAPIIFPKTTEVPATAASAATTSSYAAAMAKAAAASAAMASETAMAASMVAALPPITSSSAVARPKLQQQREVGKGKGSNRSSPRSSPKHSPKQSPDTQTRLVAPQQFAAATKISPRSSSADAMSQQAPPMQALAGLMALAGHHP